MEAEGVELPIAHTFAGVDAGQHGNGVFGENFTEGVFHLFHLLGCGLIRHTFGVGLIRPRHFDTVFEFRVFAEFINIPADGAHHQIARFVALKGGSKPGCHMI